MSREITLSLTLHLVLIMAAFISAPFGINKKPFDYGDVIKIKAVSFPEFEKPDLAPEPLAIPQAVPEETVDIPIEDPISVDKPKPVEKPIEKPKEKPKKKPTTDKNKAEKPAQTGKENGDKEIETQATSSGSPFAGATIDNAAFDYPYWFTQTFNKIAYNFRRTVSIDGSVVCVLYFRVLKSGRVIDLEVKQSSGFEAIDKDCLAAIERSAPFPPLPKDFREEIVGITLPIKY